MACRFDLPSEESSCLSSENSCKFFKTSENVMPISESWRSFANGLRMTGSVQPWFVASCRWVPQYVWRRFGRFDPNYGTFDPNYATSVETNQINRVGKYSEFILIGYTFENCFPKSTGIITIFWLGIQKKTRLLACRRGLAFIRVLAQARKNRPL